MTRHRSNPVPTTKPPRAEPEEEGIFGTGEPFAHRLGERLRRVALGGLAALIVSRTYFPGEDADAGTGLTWVLALLVVMAVAVASWWVGGAVRARWSWADAAVLALIGLVGLSVGRGADLRASITMGWEWAALGVSFLLLRWLPRTEGESRALAAVLVATACALATAGFYQVVVEDPATRAQYRAQPEASLRLAGVNPTDATARQRFESRLLGSKEPRATFALANSLAGFLVGPAVLGLVAAVGAVAVVKTKGRRPVVAFGLTMLPILAILGCLVLTKSRSAYVGLLAGLAVAGWSGRRAVGWRARLGVGVALLLGLGGLVMAAAATGQLDRKVVQQATMSLSYRAEYWRATWDLIQGSSRVFWRGVGPGNFAGPYLRYKLPTSSEEIKDPHNLVLDVWASSGVMAVAALLAALGLVAWNALGPASRRAGAAEPIDPGLRIVEARPPRRSIWLGVTAGLGGWLMVVALGHLNPFAEEDRARWLVLGSGWLLGVALIARLWSSRPGLVTGTTAGAGVVAVVVNLLAAGGIAIPPVALGLWALAAVGLNLREDRPCGRLRTVPGGRMWGLNLAMVATMLVGAFFGSVVPDWRCRAAIARAETALAKPLPDWDTARAEYLAAAAADRLSDAPWRGLADVEFRSWVAEGAKANRTVWIKIAAALEKAATPPRDPDSLAIQRLRMGYAGEVLRLQGASLTTGDLLTLHEQLANAAARAAVLYPTDATLNALLAEAVAALNRDEDAKRHAREALRLDDLTPHDDKKLAPDLRDRMRAIVEPAPSSSSP